MVCGFHGVQSLLDGASAVLLEVLLDQRRHDQRAKRLRRDLAQIGVQHRSASPEELQRLAAGVKHQGVIARIAPLESPKPPDLQRLLDRAQHPWLLLALDQVQDPHNLGACLRVADGAGVDAVILPKDGACPVNSTVIRVAAGAVGRLPVFYVANLARALADLQARGVWLTGGDDASEDTLFDMDFSVDAAIVMGAEGSGLRRLTRERCDRLARIPMAGSVSSLNVSVATGLFLFEAVRQRAS